MIETLVVRSKDYRFDFGSDIKIEKYHRKEELYFDPMIVKNSDFLPDWLLRKNSETDHKYFKRLTKATSVSKLSLILLCVTP
jgi:hypothetical protein